MKNNFKPRSKFEKWVRDYGGTKKLSKILGVNQSAVQHWCGGRARPRLETSYKIIKLSKGSLTLKDIAKGTNGL
jgi:DNA-binding transcriptional regulator YdaS (Cro superfamily)